MEGLGAQRPLGHCVCCGVHDPFVRLPRSRAKDVSSSRMRSEGFSFYFGGLGWGLGRVRSTLLSRSQPPAIVHDDDVPLESASRKVALRDIPTCPMMCLKLFCVRDAILLLCFSEDGLHSW